MKKVPCIKITEEQWNYIKLYLHTWGYDINNVSSSWDRFPILVINTNNKLGDCQNWGSILMEYYNRELITNVEEFLERAAKLKGFTYKRKDIMKINGIEIKPGMVLVGDARYNSGRVVLIAFPIQKGIGFANISEGGWCTDYTSTISNLLYIKDLAKDGFADSGKILWEKPKEVVITMDQIAEKFGISVEQIKIKK